jgi:hypothetical protein
MGDYNSSLPIRTQNAGDVVSKIADATVPSQQLAVEADGSINVNASVTATDLDIRDLSSAQDSVEVLQASHDNLNANANIQVGNADVANGNPVPISDAGGSITIDGSVTVSATDLDIRDLAFATDSVDVSGSDVTVSNTVTVQATDLDIRDLSATSDSVSAHLKDEAGNAFSNSNPLPVALVDVEGTEVNNYDMGAAIASGATSNHDYTASGAFKLRSIWASASGKMKIEVQIETASGSNTFNTAFVGFNSTANPNIELPIKDAISVVSGAKVRVIRTNNDNQAQDLYSTISGFLV